MINLLLIVQPRLATHKIKQTMPQKLKLNQMNFIERIIFSSDKENMRYKQVYTIFNKPFTYI